LGVEHEPLPGAADWENRNGPGAERTCYAYAADWALRENPALGGTAYAQSGEHEYAIKDYNCALELEPDYLAYYIIGDWFIRSGV
jgi:tetratricopeptide (TPR) repeat protein